MPRFRAIIREIYCYEIDLEAEDIREARELAGSADVGEPNYIETESVEVEQLSDNEPGYEIKPKIQLDLGSGEGC